MDANRKRTKSATWRKGVTPGGVEYYFARKPVFKARDFQEKRMKPQARGKKLATKHHNVPTRAVKEKAKQKSKAG
ncbi:MAG: hypothetical protein V4760_19470 [Bdellovibrionota bacterium]